MLPCCCDRVVRISSAHPRSRGSRSRPCPVTRQAVDQHVMRLDTERGLTSIELIKLDETKAFTIRGLNIALNAVMSGALRLKLLVVWVIARSLRRLRRRKEPVLWEMFKLASN